MCLKDIEQHCIVWEEANTWSMANQIAQRIHDESGPGKNDFLISLASYHPGSHILLHLSKYLLKWRKASPQQRHKICGNGVFSKLQKMKDAHVIMKQGQYYLEYLKFSCAQPAMNARKKVGQVAFPLHDLHCQPLIRPRQESISQLMNLVWLQARLTVSFLVYK